MFRLFSLPLPQPGGTFSHSVWVNTKSRYERVFKTFIDYYESTPMAVSPRNALYKILMHFGSGPSLDFEQWYRYLIGSAQDYAVSAHLTSTISVGKVLPSTFYGPGISEVLIAIQEPFDVSTAVMNWRDLRPVRILSHPRSDLAYNILNGSNQTDAKGYAILTVDIPLLMVQYKAFRASEENLRTDPSNRYSPMQFLHMFVLPKLIYDQIDYALLNRFANKVFNRENTKESFHSPIYLTDWSEEVDRIQESQLSYINSRSLSFGKILETLRCAHSLNQYEFLTLPEVFSARQITWALALSRFDALELLLELDSRQKGSDNTTAKRRLHIELNRFVSDRNFSNVLRLDHSRQAMDQVQRLLSYL